MKWSFSISLFFLLAGCSTFTAVPPSGKKACLHFYSEDGQRLNQFERIMVVGEANDTQWLITYYENPKRDREGKDRVFPMNKEEVHFVGSFKCPGPIWGYPSLDMLKER